MESELLNTFVVPNKGNLHDGGKVISVFSEKDTGGSTALLLTAWRGKEQTWRVNLQTYRPANTDETSYMELILTTVANRK